VGLCFWYAEYVKQETRLKIAATQRRRFKDPAVKQKLLEHSKKSSWRQKDWLFSK